MSCIDCQMPDSPPWCDCEPGQFCASNTPCSQRAHPPEACPIGTAAPNRHAGCWVGMAIAWRYVNPGDAIIGGDGRIWMITTIGEPTRVRTFDLAVTASRGADQHHARVRPDDTVVVLVGDAERAGVLAAIGGLGAELIERSVS